MNIDVEKLVGITQLAGNEIMEVYKKADFEGVVSYKDDDSPLTLADEASNDVIMNELKTAYPEIPIISEEGKSIDYENRKDFDTFWLVDPLDGTKEFINRNGEFTVNIALIKNRRPIAGFIYAPDLDTYYYGIVGEGAYKIEKNKKSPISVNNSDDKRVAVRSKSHPSPEEDVVLKRYDVVDSISVGSSLKFCMVAEGKADVYYRFGPTMEWDTAAGQAILEAAGGKVLIKTGPEPFIYNKENLLNSSFLGLGF